MRNKQIDKLKGMGAILVILGHLIPLESLVKYHIYSFHMPMFFLLSGYLFKKKEKNSKDFIKKKYSSLIKPYFIYTIISMIFYNDLVLSMGKKEIIYNFFYVREYINWNSSLWFLPVLFFTSIVMWYIFDFIKKKPYLSLLFVFIVSYFVFTYKVILPFGFHIVPFGLFFMIIGYLFKEKKILKKVNNYNIIYFVLIFITSFYISYRFGRTNMSSNLYNNLFIFFPFAIFAMLPYLKLSSYFLESKDLYLFGNYSLVIFATQRNLFKFYPRIFGRLHYGTWPYSIATSIATIAFYYFYIKYQEKKKSIT